ncbi:protein FAR1-RELATED SEQUENCE 6-like [Typha latifolia]|uniref:protein FAR1-RELATED SEQUENCE 6-like n=1 Tax=Typha latifolia TaxID=4733 RepID=UPI003C2ED403
MAVIEPDSHPKHRERAAANSRTPQDPPEAGVGIGEVGHGEEEEDESLEGVSTQADEQLKESSSGIEPVEEQTADSSEECSAEKQCATENEVAADMHEDSVLAAEDALIPKVGMRFKNVEEAFLFYTAYGYRTGFGVTRRTSHSMHGKKYRQTFTCCKEGNPRVKKALIKCRRRPIVKCGCRAMMVIKDPSLRDAWVVDYVILKHNHPLDPDRVRFMKCFRELPISIKMQLHINDQGGTLLAEPLNAVISQAAENKSSTSNQKYFRNLVDQTRKLRLGEGDAQALVKYFETMQLQNPSFFYSWDMDENGLLMNVFWADARSRASYQYFSDVISFDTSYMTSKYNMPLVLFIGVNHHGQSILLGCGLLANETTESYIWIFSRWLNCMNDKPPNAIITDQDESIRTAVAEVFPNARHRFCLWSIMKRVTEKLRKMPAKEDITGKLSKSVYNSVTVNEFEMEWEEMIEKYHLQDNDWFCSLYEDRKQWVPVYIKDMFWAGMCSTQQSENVSAFFDGYVTSKTSLKKFVEQYGGVLRDKWEKEGQEDFRSFHTSPQLISGFEFEKQIAKLYTINMFQKFQDEVRHLIQCICTRVERNGPIVTYMVTELTDNKQLDYKVIYNSAEHEVWCICRSFEFRGILCGHALCVLRQEFVMVLPSKYVLSRWRKDFKRLHAFTSIPQMTLAREMGSYDELITQGQQYLLDIAEVGIIDHDLKEYAIMAMKEARDKVLKYEVSRGDRTVDDDSLPNTLIASNICISPSVDLQTDALGLASATKILEPPRAHPRGPHNKRFINQRERSSDKLKKRRDNDTSITSKNTNLHVLENQANVGVPMAQFATQESYSVQVGSDPGPWSLYSPPPYIYWHGAGNQDSSRRT